VAYLGFQKEGIRHSYPLCVAMFWVRVLIYLVIMLSSSSSPSSYSSWHLQLNVYAIINLAISKFWQGSVTCQQHRKSTKSIWQLRKVTT